MGARLSIAVIGAGMGGLATAAALLRAGVDVTLYEQARKFARLGAGIQVGCNAMQGQRRARRAHPAGSQEVVWLGAVETPAGPRMVMVQTAVAGRPLSAALPEMSAGQRRSAARSCGQVIARLHSVPVDGFYRRHADGSFEFSDNAALRAADLANRLDNLRLLAGAGLLTQAEVHRVAGLLPEAVAARGDGPAVLCHGELFPGHIFVAAGEDEAVRVTGLIDFGDACGGRPLDDLQPLCWEWPEVDRAALAAGYGPAPFWTDRGRRLALRAGKPSDAQGYLAGLKAVLASLAI